MSAPPSRGRGVPPRFRFPFLFQRRPLRLPPIALPVLALAALAFLSGCAHHPVTIYSENDRYFAGTDRHYTNGAKLTVTQPVPRKSALAHRLDTLGRTLRHFEPYDVRGQEYAHRLSYSLGQNIYTPADIRTTALLTDDRPYAAWLYGAIAYQREERDLLQTIELQLGVLGPLALGRQIQNGFHELIGVSPAEGWGHQLHNEPGFALSYDWRYRWFRRSTSARDGTGFSIDLLRRSGLTLGNVQTSVHGGPLVRAGWNVPDDFGPDLIRFGGGTATRTAGVSAFFFASADARLVARDAFLDGNLFRPGTSHVRKRPLVGDFSLGLALYLGWLHLAYTQNYRTLEFYAQKHRDVFGSISVSVAR